MYSPVEQEALSLRSYLPMKIMSPQMSYTESHTNVFWSEITNYRATQYDLALRLLHFDMYYSQHYIIWRLLLIWTSSKLCEWRSDSCLCMFYRNIHDPDMPIELLTILSQHNTPQEMITPITIYYHTPPVATYYQQSFFPWTVKEWNNLPLSVINSDSLLTFSVSLYNNFN